MAEFSSLSRLRRSASRARSSLPAVTARSAFLPHSPASFLVSAASSSSSFSCAIMAATWARAIEMLSCMSRRIWSIIFSGSSAWSIRSLTFARIRRDSRSMIPAIDSSCPSSAQWRDAIGGFGAPEELDVHRFGAAAGERLPLAVPVEDEPEPSGSSASSSRAYRTARKPLDPCSPMISPSPAPTAVCRRCVPGMPAPRSRCDRGHARHRAVRLPADEQPLLGLARDPEEAEGLWPAVDVDLGIDQEVVAQDRDRVSRLREKTSGGMTSAIGRRAARTLSRLVARPVSMTSCRY